MKLTNIKNEEGVTVRVLLTVIFIGLGVLLFFSFLGSLKKEETTDGDRLYKKVEKYWDSHLELPSVMRDDVKECINREDCRRNLERLIEK